MRSIGTDAVAQEERRLAALRRTGILDTPPEEAFDDLTRLAAGICDMPMALVNLVDSDRQWCKSSHGVELGPVPRSQSFCAHTIATGAPLVVADARRDGRFSANPLVTGEPRIRFYAGAPLVLDDHVLGALCVLDDRPRSLADRQLHQLATLARQVVAHLRLRSQAAELQDSEDRWRSLVLGSPVAIGVADRDGTITMANPTLCQLLGRPRHEVVGRSAGEFVHPDDPQPFRSRGARIDGSPDGVLQLETRLLRPHGETRIALVTATRSPSATEPSVLVHVVDITERKVAEQAVVDAGRDLRAVGAIVRRIQEGGDARQVIVDAARELADATWAVLAETDDPDYLRVTAATGANLDGVRLPLDEPSIAVEAFTTGQPLLVPDASSSPLVRAELLSLAGGASFYGMPVLAGDTIVGSLVVGFDSPLSDIDDRRAGVVRVLADQAGVALRQLSLMSDLATLARTDPLTGLLNRRGWDEHLQQLLALAGRNQLPMTIALVDIDWFKRYNDDHGHPAGDELIRQFSRALARVLRQADTIARWGGEEFAISLPACHPAEANVVLRRLVTAVPDGQTCSVGFAVWDGRQSPAELMVRADQALYSAKRSGRATVVGHHD